MRSKKPATCVNNRGLDVPALLSQTSPFVPAMKAHLDSTAAAFDSSSAQTPADVAALIVDALNAEEMPYLVQTSTGAGDFIAASTSISDLDGSAGQDAMPGGSSAERAQRRNPPSVCST
ncbi:MAG: hypothetical protein ABI181_01145 [Mycobacteriaceae bacterium]